MKRLFRSLRFRILLPVLVLALLLAAVLTVTITHTYTGVIIRQESEKNAVRFETMTRKLEQTVEETMGGVRGVILRDSVAAYARHSLAPGGGCPPSPERSIRPDGLDRPAFRARGVWL